MTYLTKTEYLCHKWPRICSTCRKTSRSFPHSRLTIWFVTRLTRRVPLVEQELPTLPEHLSSPPVFSEVRVTRILVLCICFVDRCLSFCRFVLFVLTIVLSVLPLFDHCVVCSSIDGFLLPLWYLQTLLCTKICFYIFQKKTNTINKKQCCRVIFTPFPWNFLH